MRHRIFYSIIFFAALVITACQKDDNDTSGIGKVSFALDKLVEVENATLPLGINIGIDSFNHAGGTVDIEISGATYGTDYTTSTGSASFTIEVGAQNLVSSFSISPVDDEIIESNKVLTITLTNASGNLELGDKTTLTLTLLDNDDPLIALVGFEKATETIDENATTATTITIPFDQESTDGGIISISSTGDAVFGTDYTITGQTAANFDLTVPAGASSISFDIQAVDNTVFEADKLVTFSIAGVTGGLSLGVITETVVTITNDDLPPNPVVEFASATSSFSEGDGAVTLNLTFTSPTTEAATISVSASGDATIGSDYTFNGNAVSPYIVNVPAGVSSITLPINIIDDTDIESDETIVLDLAATTGGLDLGVNILQHTVTIVENDFSAPFNYSETFETITNIDDAGFQTVLVTQDLPAGNVTKHNNKAATYADVNDVSATSDNGMQIFYNTSSDGEGIIDNMVITPVLEATGSIDVSFDVSYVTGLAKNTAEVTLYWSDTYTGSGSFVASEWNALENITASSLDTEGVSRTGWSRRAHNITTTANFYLAIRIKQTMNATNNVVQWRFDNIKASKQ
ncbi:Calx-beta domain-containing protein [Siansivirga zeaxanthinifaciens]|uniref:Calx-beta domain-containing protein n=1 Tax=Siansivirga zeaxanthinifaciens CC-SAMT-1 TaxID=1454006 RepID=A0A0C5WFC4_9FLAO|nr:Calx-beta domain-containing protein [Siansivirga zeaxanthinifaciens]AJR04902.1 hypothetical protein AW14_08975 [Siansivirga zeaxanthinifaciens CC-SAMT-1]